MDLLMTATTAHIAEKTAEIQPPPARKIELWTAVWAPETSEPVRRQPHRTAPPAKLASRDPRCPRAAPPPAKCTGRTGPRNTHTDQRTSSRHLRGFQSAVGAAASASTRLACLAPQETADGRDVDWQAVAEQSWIKLRPNASVPIAEETRLSQEQWFPRTATSYAAAPIAEETAASEEIAPPAGKIIGKIRALTPIGISKPVRQPESARAPHRAPHIAMRIKVLRRDRATEQHAHGASRPPEL
jgi:hypothetical protein